MPNNMQSDSSRIAADKSTDRSESFAVRRARVIIAMRRSRQRPAPTIAGAMALAQVLRQPTRGRL